jgi:hypothetical protein
MSSAVKSVFFMNETPYSPVKFHGRVRGKKIALFVVTANSSIFVVFIVTTK